MSSSLISPEADRLARELARHTGETVTEAVTTALRERLVRETGWTLEGARAEIERIVAEVAELPVVDGRTPDELIGYDENGLPT